MLAERHGREPIPAMEMDHAKIEESARKYADDAYRCKRAGFKMGSIHGGHGNLIARFASQLFNKRRDDYGGGQYIRDTSSFCFSPFIGVGSHISGKFVVGK